jgi:hypothetical protein
MNDADLDALFTAARARRPDTAKAEFAFETRLLARLHEKRDNGSAWAMASWRLMPFFAVGVLALTLWQVEVAYETTDAEQAAFAQNADPLQGWSSLN